MPGRVNSRGFSDCTPPARELASRASKLRAKLLPSEVGRRQRREGGRRDRGRRGAGLLTFSSGRRRNVGALVRLAAGGAADVQAVHVSVEGAGTAGRHALGQRQRRGSALAEGRSPFGAVLLRGSKKAKLVVRWQRIR